MQLACAFIDRVLFWCNITPNKTKKISELIACFPTLFNNLKCNIYEVKKSFLLKTFNCVITRLDKIDYHISAYLSISLFLKCNPRESYQEAINYREMFYSLSVSIRTRDIWKVVRYSVSFSHYDNLKFQYCWLNLRFINFIN